MNLHMIKQLSICTLLILAQQALAQESDSSNVPLFEPAAKIDMGGSSEKEFYVGFNHAFGMENYILEGNGYSVNSGYTWGSSEQVELLHRKGRWGEYGVFRYDTTIYDTTLPNGLAQKSVRENYTKSFVDFRYYPYADQPGAAGSFYFGLGVQYQNRTVDKTSPRTFMSSSVRGGARAVVGYIQPISSSFTFEVDGALFIPVYNKEVSAQTGYYMYSFNPEASGAFVYKAGSVEFTVGVAIEYSISSFTEGGTRNVKDALETYTNYWFPVGVRFQF